MSTKFKSHKMWALYNFGRLMVVKHHRRDLAKLFVGGEADLLAGINNGSLIVHRVNVSVIHRIPKKRKKA